MKKMLLTIFAALVATSFAAIASAAGVPERRAAAQVAQQRTGHSMLAKTAKMKHQGRVAYTTAGDKETAPLNPPAVPRAYMATPARPAVK